MRRKKIRYTRYIHNKLSKTKVLLGNEATQEFVPMTKALTRVNLQEMLEQYKMVYVKPVIGTYGNGVIRVEWNQGADKPYRYQLGVKKKHFQTFEELQQSLLGYIGSHRYLVQQGIHLLTYKRNRFDIRVMVQKNVQGKWETTGIIGRVADPRKIVTNVHNGGTLKSVETLMRGYLSESRLMQFMQELRSIGVKTGKALQERYPGLKELGVDIAVDQASRPWILEVNTAPDPYIFRKLKNKSVFAKVFRYFKMHRPKGSRLKQLPKTWGLPLKRTRKR